MQNLVLRVVLEEQNVKGESSITALRFLELVL